MTQYVYKKKFLPAGVSIFISTVLLIMILFPLTGNFLPVSLPARGAESFGQIRTYIKIRRKRENHMKKELGHEAIYDARQLGTPRMLVLGLQHMFAMFGATVLVPILVQGYGLPLSIQTTLLFAGLGTLLFHVCTKMKVPAFLGSSFAYLRRLRDRRQLDAGKYAGMSGDEKLAYALGGIVIAGLLYLVLALLFKMLGAKKVMRYFPPIVTGPMIIMIGLNLSGSAINNAATCWWLALIAMAIIVVANIWGKGMVKIIPSSSAWSAATSSRSSPPPAARSCLMRTA